MTIGNVHGRSSPQYHRLRVGFRQDSYSGLHAGAASSVRYGVDEATFLAETNKLVENYAKRGCRISGEIGYLNHILTYVRTGRMPK